MTNPNCIDHKRILQDMNAGRISVERAERLCADACTDGGGIEHVVALQEMGTCPYCGVEE